MLSQSPTIVTAIPRDAAATPPAGGPGREPSGRRSESAAPLEAGGDGAGGQGYEPSYTCTAAQLRRFIKSRPYVPIHELRRRFELNGEADEVSLIATVEGTVYLGLPRRESDLVADLVRQGDVGLELCRDPRVPMVVGVFSMRPIPRG